MADDVSLVFNILSKDKASAGINQVTNTTRAANLASAASSVALGAAEASAAAWAVALGSAISGSIGLAPAVFEGATAAGVGLALALSGLGTAYKALGSQQAASGPSTAELARQHASAVQSVTSAQEALARAQRDAVSAQQAISDAEVTAAKNLRDLTISVADARLDEQSATLGVADARTALAAAQQSGSYEDIQKANIAYQQSIEDLQTAQNKTADLSEENDKATAKGVEGSDVVVSAKQQEADAVQAVRDATVQLTNAQANLTAGMSGGSAAASAQAVAMAALSSNGRAVVMAIKGIAPAWDSVQKSLQQHTLAGVAGDIRDISQEYLPVMHARLNDMGDAFNLAIRQSLGILQTKQGVSDVNTVLLNTDKALSILATAFAPIISGLLGIGAAGSDFLPMIAGWVAGLTKEFAAWVAQARASGQLGAWLGTAETALHDIWIIGGNVLGIIGDIFKAGGGASAGTGLLTTLVNLTTNLRTFMGSAKGQQDINTFFATLRGVLTDVFKILPSVTGSAGLFKDTLTVAAPVVHELADHVGALATALPFLAVGYGLVKAAQSLSIVRDIIHLPILAASAVANWTLAAAIRGQLAATEAATVGEEEMDAAFIASPIGLVILLIVALVAMFVLLWTKCSWFRDFWKGLWHDIQDAAGAVWNFIKEHWELLLAILTGPVGLAVLFIKDHFKQILDFVTGLPGKITKAASGMWDGVKDAFKSAINFIIRGWDSIHLKLPSVDTHIPGIGVIGGFDLRVPQLKQLAAGGIVKATPGGTAIVAGEAGEDEAVVPLSRLSNSGGGGQIVQLEWTGPSSDSEFVAWIMKHVRATVKAQGGNLATLGLKAPRSA